MTMTHLNDVDLGDLERRLHVTLAHPRSAAVAPELVFVREALRRVDEAVIALEAAEAILGIRTRVGA